MHKTVDELASRWLPAGEIGEAEMRVLQSAIDRRPVARNARRARAAKASRGERLADAIARVGGSWSFILCFLGFLALWAGLNVWLLAGRAFDPYPFVFLNLILSMLAAVQAAVRLRGMQHSAPAKPLRFHVRPTPSREPDTGDIEAIERRSRDSCANFRAVGRAMFNKTLKSWWARQGLNL